MDYISIDNFEGPLDLLLHLVKESNIDIFDIKVEEITDKYLDYINHEENLNINISSSYLVMAAELMYLKSKLLLPSNKKEEDNSEEDEEITRENLINKLLEYKKYKEMTPVFKELEEERKKIYIKAPEKVSNYTESVLSGEDTIDNLLEAFKKFLERKELDKSEKFDIKAVKQTSQLTTNAVGVTPIIVDVNNAKVLWIDEKELNAKVCHNSATNYYGSFNSMDLIMEKYANQ